MEPPLYIFADDLEVFEDRESAERYLEPIDIKSNPGEAFDSQGRVLRLGVVEIRGTWGAQVEHVQVEDTEEFAPERLRESLASHYARAEVGTAEYLASRSLEDLIAMSRRFITR